MIISPGTPISIDKAQSTLPMKNRYAPWYDIPSSSPSIVSIEHPCIIQNVEKGVQTLGGAATLTKVSRPSKYLSKHRPDYEQARRT